MTVKATFYVMRIAVGLPSYQEADNIGFVTKQVDRGLTILKSFFKQIEDCAIFNIDNGSTDGTQEIFKKTKTAWQKYCIKTKGLPGKGKNLFAFFNEMREKYFDVILTFDSDLRSIEPEWIVKFTEPFIKGKCDLVLPIYERNRFEGSTTNHFAYPLIYTFFGKDIRQPIAGDIALSRRFVDNILNKKAPKETKKYGIDIFITIEAIMFHGSIKQIKLGQKIHKPSFPKLKTMFPQIASSALDLIRTINLNNLPLAEGQDNTICINQDVHFLHRKQAEALLKKQKIGLISKLNSIYWLGEIKEKISKNLNGNNFYFDQNIWAEILSSWLSFFINHQNEDSFKYANQLLPFFILRTVNFWTKIINYKPQEVESEIRSQAQLIRKKIINKLIK